MTLVELAIYSVETIAGTPGFRVIHQSPPSLHCVPFGGGGPARRICKARLKILVVDDEDLFRDSVACTLRSLCEAEIEEAETASLALERVSTEDRANFDLILMDIALPDLSGLEAYQAMRSRGIGTTIVLMSARADNRTLAEGLGVPFLDKPLDDAALEAILQGCGGGEAS